jgi:hypothetical protein
MAMTPLRHADLPDEVIPPGDNDSLVHSTSASVPYDLKAGGRWPRLLKMGDLTGEPVAYLDRAFVEVPDSVTLSDILTFLTETDKKS